MRNACRHILALTLLAMVVGGCTSTPEPDVEPLSIASLRGLYKGHPTQLTTNKVMGGAVVSSDRHGEHHHRLVVQDATGGIVICIDHSELYTDYSIGDSLVVRLTGLWLGSYGGDLRLGGAPTEGYEVSELDWGHWRAICHPQGVAHPASVEPKPLRIGQIRAADLATRVVIQGARFVEVGQTWAEEGASLNRHLVDTATPTDTLTLHTSGRTDFWWRTIPEGEWNVEGILGIFAGRYQIVIASPDALVLPTR